jgi:hypothetical protein
VGICGIRSNDSSSCYWHSLHGVVFSYIKGLLYKKIETLVDFTKNYDVEQESCFKYNRDVINTFVNKPLSLFPDISKFCDFYFEKATQYGLKSFFGRIL